MSRNQSIFVFDAAMFAALCVIESPRVTRIPVHEWLGISLIAGVLVHLLLSWSWIASNTRRLILPKAKRDQINYLLNLGLFISMTGVIFSGILISEVAFPRTGNLANGKRIWSDIHSLAANLVLLFAGLHVA